MLGICKPLKAGSATHTRWLLFEQHRWVLRGCALLTGCKSSCFSVGLSGLRVWNLLSLDTNVSDKEEEAGGEKMWQAGAN